MNKCAICQKSAYFSIEDVQESLYYQQENGRMCNTEEEQFNCDRWHITSRHE